jgi:hypothetical protein
MKKAAWILIVIGLVLAAGLTVLQGVVNRKLAQAVARGGMQASSIGIRVAAGSAEVTGFKTGNPPGFPDTALFSLEQGRVAIRYGSLLRGRLRAEEVLLKDAVLAVVRLEDGRLNVRRGAPSGGDGGGSGTPPPEPVPTPSRRGPLPAVGVDKLLANLSVQYSDFSKLTDGKPYEALFRVDVTGSDLATYGDPADESGWGTLAVDGYVESGGKRAPIHLKGRIAPLSDPMLASFRLQGTIDSLDSGMVRPLLGKNNGIKGEAERLEVTLVCDKGRFVERESKLTLTLKNVKTGKRILPAMTLDIPVHGTVEKPKLRLEEALFGALAQMLAAPAEEGSGKKKSKGDRNAEAISKGLELLLKGK